MEHSRSSALLAPLLFVVLSNCALPAAADAQKQGQDGNQSALFLRELVRHGDFQIRNDPESCLSKARPLRLSEELSEMLFRAAGESATIGLKSTCKLAKGAEPLSFCQLYFHSTSKKRQWTVGFTFLGQPASGEIDLESLACFGT